LIVDVMNFFLMYQDWV